ncbi:GNAT family N-acetyltransferase [Lysinibacter sp. HNR]|uniref:GNAT family N-acetyltransferase n=1 Tax=Lysinibacter sp. HNR TaxID=3031408 RepID=UPI002435843D|nr:GNAT family N-acetyltransferase [Lysinibacter sp. HNR]WGD36550.1 GNAT family N-acetyltransferase [Lysinibacter sp. HNR]
MELLHLGTQRLETERLILRRFTVDDAQAMFRNWASDDAVTEYLAWPTHRDEGVSRGVLSDWVESYERDSYYTWAIELVGLDEPIGSIGAVRTDDDLRLVEIGYCIGKPWWNQGIVTEALQALTAFFIERVGINRIEATHVPQNPGSGRVMIKSGFRYEGTLRQRTLTHKGVFDAEMYALLAEDR